MQKSIAMLLSASHTKRASAASAETSETPCRAQASAPADHRAGERRCGRRRADAERRPGARELPQVASLLRRSGRLGLEACRIWPPTSASPARSARPVPGEEEMQYARAGPVDRERVGEGVMEESVPVEPEEHRAWSFGPRAAGSPSTFMHGACS